VSIASSGGAITASTNGASALTITTGQILQFNSGYGSVATAYGCRAWVNFNGTGTVAIRANGNVTSITDNGTGDYTVNFTTAMSDANYSCLVSGKQSTGTSTGGSSIEFTSLATGSVRILCADGGSSAADFALVSVAIFR